MPLEVADLINILDTIDGGLDLDGVEKKFNEETLSPLPIDLDEMITGRRIGRDESWRDILSEELIQDIYDSSTARPDAGDAHGITATDSAGLDEPSIWEACAWYQPITFYGLNWGIYMREDCVISFSKEISFWLADYKTNLTPRTFAGICIRSAILLFYLHEFFHHKLESAAIKMAVIRRTAPYPKYFRNVYRATLGTDSCLEEALANADAYRRLGEKTYCGIFEGGVLGTLRSYLRDIRMPHEPPGYRCALQYLSELNNRAGKDALIGQLSEASLNTQQPSTDWAGAPQLLRALFSAKSNLYLLVKKGQKPLVPTRVLNFQVGDKQVIKKAIKMGYREVPRHGKGSHTKLKSKGRPTLIVPRGKHLSSGTLQSLKSSLELRNIADFLK